MSLFDVDFQRLARAMTPVQLWKGRLKAFLLALWTPVVSLYNLFTANRAGNLYKLGHSSQVVYMEAVLNDAFDNVLRRITIVDGPYVDSPSVYRRAEGKPLYIYRASEAQHRYIYRSSETAITGPDFVVQVPIGLAFDTARMKALINDYRLASKKDYLIISV